MNWHEYFHIDDATGVLYWKERPRFHFKTDRAFHTFNGKYVGHKTGHIGKNGYARINIDGHTHRAHRIIWEMRNGPLPKSMDVDHINGIRHDNRPSNLRSATRSQNMRNRGANKNNTVGFKGVSFHKQSCKFMASIDGIYLGLFETPSSAHDAYVAEATVRHGQYIRTT